MLDRALVGRDREVAVLDDAIGRARAAARCVVVLSGEPGIGKSRLLDELAARIARVGGVAVWGRNEELGLTAAFWPWLQMLAGLETHDDPAPDLASLEEPARAATRLARFEAVVAFVHRRADVRPLALLFDDAHVADLSSLQLLDYVVPRLQRARVVVAIAARDREAGPQVATILGRIQRGALRLPLSPLGRDDVAALVRGRVAAAAAARVWELSEGNPLFVEELVASCTVGGEVALPRLSSVRAVIRDRVARLPAETVAALVAAAVVGRDARGAVVADMLAIDPAELARRLAPAVRVGMVALVTANRYRFSHALVAEALTDELELDGAPETTRADLHLAAARAIEAREPEDRNAIAHHLLAAGRLAAGAAVVAAELAATRAVEQLAFEDAAVLLERALDALALAAPGDRVHRVRLLCARAEALQHAGDHARASATCDEAIAIARELDDDDRGEWIARIALARGIEMRFGHAYPELIVALREAEAALPSTSPTLAKVLARLAAAEQPAIDPMVPVARARSAIALSSELARRGAAADRDRLEVLYTATGALLEYVPAAELEPILAETRTRAELARARVISVHTLVRSCFTALARADRAAFEQRTTTVHAEAAGLGARWVTTARLLESADAVLDGRWSDSDRAIAAAMVCDPDDWKIHFHRGLAAMDRGPLPDDARTRMLAYGPGLSSVAAWLAEQDGDDVAALAAVTDLAGEGTFARAERSLVVMAAPAIAWVGTTALAEHAYRRLSEERADPVVVFSMVGSIVGELLDRALLLLASKLGKWDAFDVHAERALAVAAGLESPVWAARVQLVLGRGLLARDRDGDRARATELLAQVAATAERLDLPGLLARARSATPATTPDRSTARSAPAPRVDVAQQGELWIVSGFGERIHVKRSRGMEMLARLVGEPWRELHALDLVGAPEAVDGGDSGEVLDKQARAAYKARLAALVEERDRAEAWGDLGRLERASAEIDALARELQRAVGLGGRVRRTGGASERARSNVQRRIQHAIDQVRSASPRIGEHLAASIRTGTFCAYEPRD